MAVPVAVLVLGLAACEPRVPGEAKGTASQSVRATPVDAGTEIPDRALVTRRDLGGAGWDEVALPAASGWSFALRDCVGYRDADYPAQRKRVAVRGTAFTQGRAGRAVQALVELYPSGWSAQALDDVRGVVQTCGRYEHTARLLSHSVVEVDFAGEEALLVHSTEVVPDKEPAEWWTAVVRRDDLVATVTGHGLTDIELRKIALKAAAKLG